MIKSQEISRLANSEGVRPQQILEKGWTENLSHQIKDLRKFKDVWRDFNKQLRIFEKCKLVI